MNREVTHLDKIYYKSGWQEDHATRDEWKQKVENLASGERWIIDGHYNSTLNLRIPEADTIIFLDVTMLKRLYRVFKRSLDKTQPFDKPIGNFNRIRWNLIKKIIIFKRKNVLAMLEPYKDTKKVFVVTNNEQVRQLLEKLSAN